MKCANKSISTNVRFSANFNQAQEIIYKTTIRQITDCKKKKVKILYAQGNKDKGNGRFLVKSKKYKEKTVSRKFKLLKER